MATGLYVGATAGVPLFALPAARAVADPLERRRLLAGVLRFYDPLAIALLGIMVMTGAWSITGFKQNLGNAYFDSFGQYMVWKLTLAFFVVMFGTYVSMGIGHRIVREDDWSDEVDVPALQSLSGRLGGSAWLTVLVTLATVVVASLR